MVVRGVNLSKSCKNILPFFFFFLSILNGYPYYIIFSLLMGFENRRHSQAHPLGPKREAGLIKHPGPERRPKKEKPNSLAPEAYDVDN